MLNEESLKSGRNINDNALQLVIARKLNFWNTCLPCSPEKQRDQLVREFAQSLALCGVGKLCFGSPSLCTL